MSYRCKVCFFILAIGSLSSLFGTGTVGSTYTFDPDTDTPLQKRRIKHSSRESPFSNAKWFFKRCFNY